MSTAHLPPRYREDWFAPWDERVQAALFEGAQVLDVGSGRRPAINQSDRPPNVRYVGLDLAEAELQLADAGSYDEMVVADVTQHQPDLEDRFDLIVSYQVLEHVKRLDRTVENLRRYLRPGGRLVAQLSGRYSVFGLINLAIPSKIGVRIVEGLLPREKGTVFPAYYNRCSTSGLRRAFSAWSQVEVVPRWNGAVYFSFARPMERTYVAYENWALRNGHDNLATHYLISATK